MTYFRDLAKQLRKLVQLSVSLFDDLVQDPLALVLRSIMLSSLQLHF